jgi:hypothetical protein
VQNGRGNRNRRATDAVGYIERTTSSLKSNGLYSAKYSVSLSKKRFHNFSLLNKTTGCFSGCVCCKTPVHWINKGGLGSPSQCWFISAVQSSTL